MKNAVFWDVAPCRYFVNRRFGGTSVNKIHGATSQKTAFFIFENLFADLYPAFYYMRKKITVLQRCFLPGQLHLM
jgi:hypothetical protein